ncbi:prepilin-type N-terminal cleavage/methylation domain-containing protein [Plesiomonas shigelloides subsp. oncorhynchi]|nr:prepilin-type N-terminal cleavage/methylation domain-containing protein [Plesiomonas shigelloides]
MTFINKKGFSLIEVLIAVLVLGVSTSALIGYQIKQSTTLEFSNMTLIATEAANNVLDEVQSKSKEIRKKMLNVHLVINVSVVVHFLHRSV